MGKIAIFASGSGSNAENIIRHFAGKEDFCITRIYCNVPDAYVLERAKQLGVPATVFTREEFRHPEGIFRQLHISEVSGHAGFLRHAKTRQKEKVIHKRINNKYIEW